MGAQQSFLLATQLQNHTLAELLENDKFVNSLEAGAFKLSRKSRANLQNLIAAGRKTAKANSRLKTAKLKPLLKVQESEITPPSSIVLMNLNSTSDWRRFFWGEVDAQIFSDHASQVSALLHAYKHTFAFEKRQPVDRIRWRFYTMFFYDLHCLVNEKINITSKAIQSVIFAIDPSGKYFDEINANIRSWIGKGHRYRNISKSLGGAGCLFLLPESISDYLWEESLPLSGPTHVEAVNRLRSLGIVDKSIELGVDELADAIEEGLLDPFRNKISSDCVKRSDKLLQIPRLAPDGFAEEFPTPGQLPTPSLVSDVYDPNVPTLGAHSSSSSSALSDWIPNAMCDELNTPPIQQISGFVNPFIHQTNIPSQLHEQFWLYHVEPELG